jgi:hypothetical protein
MPEYTFREVQAKIEAALQCYLGEVITPALKEEVRAILFYMSDDPDVFEGIKRDKW